MPRTEPLEILVDLDDLPAWREARRKGLGSSDAPAIVGLDQYRTPYAVWADKVHGIEEDENDAMRMGKLMEEVVAQSFSHERDGVTLIKPTCMYQHPTRKYVMANPDRFVHEPELGPVVILECKNAAGRDARDDWTGDEPPDRVQVQVQHQLAVFPDMPYAYAAAVLYGRELRYFRIERDEEAITAILKVEADFWNKRVLGGDAPPVDGGAATSRALAKLYPNAVPEKSVELGDFGRTTLAELAHEKSIEKAAKERAERLTNAVKAYMGDSHVGLLDGDEVCTLPTVPRTEFDLERFRRDHPGLAGEYLTASSYRRLDRKTRKVKP